MFDVERLARLFVEQRLKQGLPLSLPEAAQVAAFERDLRAVDDDLKGHVQPREEREAGAQDFVPADDGLQRSLQRGLIQTALDQDGALRVEGVLPLRPLLKQPEPSLLG